MKQLDETHAGNSNANEHLEAGALVQHKTGGPAMVVVGVDKDERTCRWYDLSERRFKLEAFSDIELLPAAAEGEASDA